MADQTQQFSDLPAGASVISAPPEQSSGSQFSDLPPGASVVHAPSTDLPSAASPIVPPPVARPNVPMSNSTLGTIYGGLAHGPDGAVINPKLAGSQGQIAAVQQDALNPSVITQVGAGALDSALQTVHSAARVANAVTGDHIPGLPTSFKEPEGLEPHGLAEGAGSVAEQLAEFALGEGEVKAGATALAEHYGQVSKLAKVIEQTPLLQKALNIARVTAVSAAQSGAHGQSPVQGAAYGAAGGAAGEGLGALGEWIGTKTPEAMTQAAQADFESKEASLDIKRAMQQSDARRQLSEAATAAYDRLQGKYGKPVGDVFGRNISQEIVSYGDLAHDLKTQAKPVFDQLDKETNGAFEATNNKIAAARKIIRNPSSMDALEQAQTSLADGETAMDAIFEDSKSVSRKDLDDARSMWKTMSTLNDLNDRLDRSISVPQKAHSLLPSPSAGNPTIDPKKFNTQLNNAVRSIPKDRLIEALGEDGVRNLYTINQKLAETVADESRATALNRVLRDAVRNAPKGSPLSTIGYGLLTGAGGATLGAGIGAARANAKGTDITSGAAEGATIGAGAGVVAGIPVGMLHLMYTHPNWGSKVLDLAAKSAPLGSQAVKTATHQFNPDTGEVEPVQQQSQ